RRHQSAAQADPVTRAMRACEQSVRTRKVSVMQINSVPRRPNDLRNALRLTTRLVAVGMIASLLGGCYGLERLRWVGDTPPLAAIENPTAKAGYKPVQM